MEGLITASFCSWMAFSFLAGVTFHILHWIFWHSWLWIFIEKILGSFRDWVSSNVNGVFQGSRFLLVNASPFKFTKCDHLTLNNLINHVKKCKVNLVMPWILVPVLCWGLERIKHIETDHCHMFIISVLAFLSKWSWYRKFDHMEVSTILATLCLHTEDILSARFQIPYGLSWIKPSVFYSATRKDGNSSSGTMQGALRHYKLQVRHRFDLKYLWIFSDVKIWKYIKYSISAVYCTDSIASM
jgi:hypothetical protein